MNEHISVCVCEHVLSCRLASVSWVKPALNPIGSCSLLPLTLQENIVLFLRATLSNSENSQRSRTEKHYKRANELCISGWDRMDEKQGARKKRVECWSIKSNCQGYASFHLFIPTAGRLTASAGAGNSRRCIYDEAIRAR
jgi:hypothetical protein